MISLLWLYLAAGIGVVIGWITYPILEILDCPGSMVKMVDESRDIKAKTKKEKYPNDYKYKYCCKAQAHY